VEELTVKHLFIALLSLSLASCADMFSDYDSETAHFTALAEPANIGEQITLFMDSADIGLKEKFLPNGLPVEFSMEIKVPKPINNYRGITGPSSENVAVYISMYVRSVGPRGTITTTSKGCPAGAKFTTRLSYKNGVFDCDVPGQPQLRSR